MNKQLFITFGAVIFLFGLVSCADHSTDNAFDGVWRIDARGNGDVMVSSYFVLEQEGEELKGYVIMNNAVEIPIENVIANDTAASFTIFWGAQFHIYPEMDQLRIQTSWHGAPPFESMAIPVSKEEIQ